MIYDLNTSLSWSISFFLILLTKFLSRRLLVSFSLQYVLKIWIVLSTECSLLDRISFYINISIVRATLNMTDSPFIKNKSQTTYSTSRGNSPTNKTINHLKSFCIKKYLSLEIHPNKQIVWAASIELSAPTLFNPLKHQQDLNSYLAVKSTRWFKQVPRMPLLLKDMWANEQLENSCLSSIQLLDFWWCKHSAHFAFN